MISTVELDVVAKLILAAVLGGLVGLERERDRRPAPSFCCGGSNIIFPPRPKRTRIRQKTMRLDKQFDL